MHVGLWPMTIILNPSWKTEVRKSAWIKPWFPKRYFKISLYKFILIFIQIFQRMLFIPKLFSWGLGIWHILGTCDWKNLKINAFLCREISTTTLLAILQRHFVFILCLFCVSLVYLCIAYWLLPYVVHDNRIQYK